MAQPREWEHQIGVGLEATFGTAVAPTLYVPGTSKLKVPAGVRMVDRPTGQRYQTRWTTQPRHVTGSTELEVAPGRESIVTALLTMKDRRLPNTYTIYDILGDVDGFINAGCAVNTASLKCSTGEDLVVSYDWIGRTRTRMAKPLTPPVQEYPAPYVYEEIQITLAGGAEYEITDVELSVDRKLKDDKYGTTGLLREIPSDGDETTVKLTHEYSHPQIWEAAMARIEMSLSLLFVRGSASFGIVLPRLICTEPDVSENVQELELTALATVGDDGTVTPPVTFTPA
jgi:hypothetical protein